MTDIHSNQPAAPESEQDTVWEQEIAFIDSVPRWLAMSFVFLVFVGTWHLVTSLGLVSPIILPTPLETLNDMIFVGKNLLTGDYMLGSLWITIKEVIYGFALAIAIGFSLGVLVGETAFGEKAVMPYLVAIDTILGDSSFSIRASGDFAP